MNYLNEIEDEITDLGFGIISKDFERPWGGFLVIDENQSKKFITKFFKNFDFSKIKNLKKLSPKLLIIKPKSKLSWQYHNRRSEIWKIIKGKVAALPGHNKTLATIGVMALWFGWFGFNGGSQLAWGGENTVTATTIVLFTNLSAAAGAVGALVTTWILYKKPDMVQTLNGGLAGLVSITAGAGNMNPYGAFFAGLIGGVIVVFAIEFIEKKLKIDDAIGASSVHGVVGVWGTIVIGLRGIDSKGPIGILNGGGYEQLISQIIGALAYSIWAAIFAFIFFWILNKAVGLRVTREEEVEGLDIAEHGIRAYPGKRNR